MNRPSIQDIVKQLDLRPHPEGGFYREYYRSEGMVPKDILPRHGGERNFATDIFFLLPEGSISVFHKIKSDEIWHFYMGGPLTLVQISPEGKVDKVVLGPNIMADEVLWHLVPPGYWFGAYPNSGSVFSLVSCTVIPGFDFADFEMGKRAELLEKYPKAKTEIVRLTRE